VTSPHDTAAPIAAQPRPRGQARTASPAVPGDRPHRSWPARPRAWAVRGCPQ